MDQDKTTSASRIERKKEKTTQRIIDTSITLFRQHSFDAVTMEQIADEVDIAKGTLYNYFPCKEAILSEYIQRAAQDKRQERILVLHQLPDTRSRLISILNELIAGIQAQAEIFEKYFTYQLQNILSLEKTDRERSGIEDLAAEIIRLGQESGEIRTDLPQGILEDQFDFVVIEVAKQFYHAPETFNASLVIERTVDLYMNGMKEPG